MLVLKLYCLWRAFLETKNYCYYLMFRREKKEIALLCSFEANLNSLTLRLLAFFCLNMEQNILKLVKSVAYTETEITLLGFQTTF